MSRRERGELGFTLIELAVVLLITGILAALAVSTYFRMISKARMAQASIVLKHLHKMETVHFSEKNAYTDNVTILDFDPVQYDYYRVTVTIDNTGQDFLGVAEGVGPMAGDRWTIDKDGVPAQDNAARLRF
ncbi:MAG: prepilin-type N-terminal cleavage/methylation domain-containing protein [Deltaproteobacteria bacterium]|nr:MAG: prepilin-type N-terminal cleavage/methylation domain-containing protein [Deltaproteobacteria bacterium]